MLTTCQFRYKNLQQYWVLMLLNNQNSDKD